MKIIDLIVKLAKGEKVPKKIKYQGDIYLYNEDDNVYEALEYCQTLLENVYECDLNDEIEIIEEAEDKEYEDIEEIDIEELGRRESFYPAKQDRVLQNEINVLIRNQKYILERLDNDK